MKPIILILTLLWSQVSMALVDEYPCDDVSIGTILASDHITSPNNDHNENQWPSLYVQCSGWTVGFYENSYSNQKYVDERLFSWMFGYEHDWYRSKYLTVSTSLGMVTGYPKEWNYKNNGKLEVTEKVMQPWASLNLQTGPIKVWLLPSMDVDRRKVKFPSVIAVGLEWGF